MYEWVKVELSCRNKKVHQLSVRVKTSRGVPERLVAEAPVEFMKDDALIYDCCELPLNLELLVLREIAFGGIEDAKTYGWIKVDISK